MQFTSRSFVFSLVPCSKYVVGEVVVTEVIDKELLQGYVDSLGIGIVEKMLNMYIDQSQLYIADIVDALPDGGQKLWHERCHKMKGAAGSVGMKKVHAHLVIIEKSTETAAIKQQHIQELVSLNDSAISAFREWLAAV